MNFKISRIIRFAWRTILFWILAPIILFLLFPHYIIRLWLKFIVRYLHPDWVGILDPPDALVYEDLYETNHVNNSFTLRINTVGHFNLKEFSKLFHDTILARRDSNGKLVYEKFTFYCETWWKYPFWKRDKNFKLENHIHFTQEFQQQELSEEDIEIFMGEHNFKPFELKRSPWEFLVFKRRSTSKPKAASKDRKEDRFTIYCRFHHVLFDGFSMVKMLSLLNDPRNKYQVKKDNFFVPVTRERKSNWRFMFNLFVNFIVFGGYEVMSTLFDYDKNIWKMKEKELSSSLHMVTTNEMSFKIARVASESIGTSTTSILLGAISGGIHSYLKDEDQKKELPESMRVCAAMPIPNHPHDGMVNHWTFVIFKLPIREADPEKRIRKIEEQLIVQKTSTSPLIMWMMAPIYTYLPIWLGHVMWNRMSTLNCSNFRGPKHSSYFGEYEAESIQAYLPRPRGTTAIGIVIATYNGNINYTICADKALMAERMEVQRLGQYIVAELKHLSTIKPHHYLTVQLLEENSEEITKNKNTDFNNTKL